jgi:hypothetical protein
MKIVEEQADGFNPIRGHHPDLFGAVPEVIGAEDLPVLNAMLAYVLAGLRQAAADRGKAKGRRAAVTALNVAWVFFAAFKPVLAEGLHASLLNLLDAVRALDDGNVAPLLRPSPPRGRAPDSRYREALLTAVILAVGMLRAGGMQLNAAYQLVADHLDRLGVKPSRGSGHITARTVRGWCAKAAEDVGGHTLAGRFLKFMDSEEWRSKSKTVPPGRGRQLALELLTSFTELSIGVESRKKPVSPPS